MVGFKKAVVAQSLKTKNLVTFCVAFSTHDIQIYGVATKI
jgi:hypothetical protein